MNELVIAGKKSPVEYRREFAQSPEVLAVLNPVERALLVASTDKPFSDYDSTDLGREFIATLKWVAKDIGCRVTDPADWQYIVIRVVEVVRRYYSDFTMKDFRLAFEMSLTGELDAYLPKDRNGMPDKNHYGAFNVEYIGKILNAYKGARLEVLRKANRVKPVEFTSPAPSDEERKKYSDSVRKDCVFAFLHYKYRGRLPYMTPIGEMLCYERLAIAGLADPIEVTLEEQREILAQTMQDFRMRGLIYDARQVGLDDSGVKHRTYVSARRRALERAFEQMVLGEIQINDYL